MNDQKTQGWILAAAGAAVALGSFLPWASVLGISISGMDGGDGNITLILGIVIAAVGVMLATRDAARWMTIVGLVAVAILLVVWLIDFFDVSGTDGVSVGFGLWLILLGIIAAAVVLVKRQMAKA